MKIDEYIATLSVVTNQGQVYVMQKSDDFHYDEARQLINALSGRNAYEGRNTENPGRIKSLAQYFCSEKTNLSFAIRK